MSISAQMNCTPIKPQVSFGSNQEKDYEKVVSAANKIADSYTSSSKDGEERPEQKSKMGTLVSVATAALLMYAGGKFAASKVNEVFPKVAPALENGLRKSADFIREKTAVLSGNGNRVASTIGKIGSKTEQAARNIYKSCIKKGGDAAESMKNLAGAAALATGFPKVVTVDGNEDGVRDISQKNVNAYKNAMEQVSVLSDIVDVLS